MKATPIAQYLDRNGKGGLVEWPASRSAASAFMPRLAAANAEGTLETRALRPGAEVGDPGSAPAVSARRDSPFFRPREAASRDIESRLSEAYHRGVQEGLDTATAEAASARALERAETQKRAVVERLDFQMNEYARLADLAAARLDEIEKRIADVVAGILRPLVAESVARQIVDELIENIGRLRSAGAPPLLKVRGPERLLKLLRTRLAGSAVEVQFSVDEGVEVIADLDHTTIATEIAPWIELIESTRGPD